MQEQNETKKGKGEKEKTVSLVSPESYIVWPTRYLERNITPYRLLLRVAPAM
jgi:hypothetical protein